MAQMLFGPNGFIHADEDKNGNVTIMWAAKPYYSFSRTDHFAKNLGIYLLASIKVRHKDIQRLFAVSGKTVKRILALIKKNGFQALTDYRPGAPELDQKIKDFVIAHYTELEGTRGYQTMILDAVKDQYQKGEFFRTISRQSLYMIIKEYRHEREQIRQENEERERRKGQAKKEAEQREEEEQRRVREQPDLPEEPREDEPTVVDCGGAVVTAVFVNEFQTMDSIPEGCGEQETEGRFTNREMAFAYVALNAAKVVRVEQDFKTLPSYMMGGILGREKLPSLSLYRSRIPTVVEHMDMEEVIRQTARRMSEIFPFSRVLYIDGHFLPYYGGTAVLGNYSSQRRLVTAGREYFWVHDENGVPVYATISDGYRKMRFYLRQVNGDLKWIYGAKRRELLLVFDRGGYSKGFCVGITDEVRFICWRTDARAIPKVVEWEKVEVEREGNEWGEPTQLWFGAWERDVEFEVGKKKRVFREVWIRKGRKVSPALTNDQQMPLADVVRTLVRRWGAQENGFKKLKAHGVDLIHSYEKEPYSEEYLYESGLEEREEGIQREVDNPAITELDRKIGKVKRKIERQRDARERAEKKGEKAALAKIKGKLAYLNRRMKQLKEAKGKEPEKVLLYQIIQDKGIERIKPEKKLFFDWLKMSAVWSRKRIVEIVKPYYEDLRDVEKFVDGILQSRTYVLVSDAVMYVEFPNQHSKQKQGSLERLCEELNRCEGIDIGLSIQKLVFSVR
jgi:hypothetical protein